jgi:hypothetical protein
MATATDIAAFRSQFSEITPVTDPQIAAVLNVTDVIVQPALWPSAKDYVLARMTYAAHLLTLVLMNTANATIDGTGMSDLFVSSIGFGERHVSFSRRTFEGVEGMVGPGENLLPTTIYGQLYLQLRNRNIVAVAIV